MDSTQTGELTTSSPVVTRALTLAADRSLWAGDQNACIAITARIYDFLDNLEMGLKPDVHSRRLAANTAAWVAGKTFVCGVVSSANAPV